MITVRIGDSESSDINDAHWINEQIRRRRKDGQDVCVTVRIEEGQLRLTLGTPACPRGRGGRVLNDDERSIFELWNKHHLNDASFSGGDVVAFLKQLSRQL